MIGYSFVFVHVYSDSARSTSLKPDESELNSSMWECIPYVRMRHSDIKEHHWVLCVRDALEIMRQKLILNNNSIVDEVHFYTHGTYNGGEILGRLREGNEAIRVINLLEAEDFLRFELRSNFLRSRSHAATTIHIHGCNIGVSADAVRVWRDIFGATRGFGKAPKLFQMFHKQSLPMRKYQYPSGNPINVDDLIVLSEKDINTYIETVISTVLSRLPSGISKAKRDDFEKEMRNKCQNDVNEEFYKIFKKYLEGGELPWLDVNEISMQEAISRIRIVFFQNSGFPKTFLARHYHPYNQIPVGILSNTSEYIWPHEKTRWENNHTWFPYCL